MNASLISMFISYTDNGTVPFNQTMDFLRNQTLNETLGFTTPLPAEPIQLNYPLYMTICVSLFYTIIFLCGVGGNVLVLFVVWRNRDMRNSTNLFLVNLSAADLLVLIVCMPTAMAEFYGKEIWYIGEAMCKYFRYSVFFACVFLVRISQSAVNAMQSLSCLDFIENPSLCTLKSIITCDFEVCPRKFNLVQRHYHMIIKTDDISVLKRV